MIDPQRELTPFQKRRIRRLQIPSTSSTQIVFHHANFGSDGFYYKTVEYNPLQTKGVISEHEVKKYLEQLQLSEGIRTSFDGTLIVLASLFQYLLAPLIAILFLVCLAFSIITIILWILLIGLVILSVKYTTGYCQEYSRIKADREAQIPINLKRINEELKERKIRFTIQNYYATLELDYMKSSSDERAKAKVADEFSTNGDGYLNIGRAEIQ